MKKILAFLIISAMMPFLPFQLFGQGKVAFLVESPDSSYVPFTYLLKEKSIQYDPALLSFGDATANPGKLRKSDVMWFHREDTASFSSAMTDPKTIKILKDFIRKGGTLLLTDQAFSYINTLGLESVIPTDSIKPCTDEGYGRKLGYHAFREHPVFAGMNGGAYVWVPEKDQKVHVTGFFGDQVPKNGKVIAVDWDYIFLRENSKIIVEYDFGKGKVIAAGGYIDFVQPNRNSLQMNLFLKNTLDYLSGKYGREKQSYWDYTGRNVIPCNSTHNKKTPAVQIGQSTGWTIPVTPEDIKAEKGNGDYFDLAGERMLTMGSERGGIEEAWAHPFMAFRDYRAGIRFEGTDSVIYLDQSAPDVTINPAFFSRTYRIGRSVIKEIFVNDPVEPCGVVHYEITGPAKAELYLTFKSNLRLMWPYPESATGDICHGWDRTNNAFVIRNGSGELVTMAGANRIPVRHESGKGTGMEATCMGIYPLSATDRMDFVYAASSEETAMTASVYEKAIQNPEQVLQNALSHVKNLFSTSLVITTPDQNFNRGYRWALVATDRFFVTTPGMGSSLVAGYATTKRGWDGGQKVSGRPGYGWYFGRDGEWSGMALLDYGDFCKVRSILEFYNKYQDLNGKIFHEATTSGVIHYDAADAPPLYIILAGRYLRWSDDTAFIRKTWPNIRKAIRFCFSTDTDNDHLIENTNVGHGWVEGGELYGCHATLYLNACWSEALREASAMAFSLKDPDAEIFFSESEIVKNIINSSFWIKKEKFYSYGMNADCTFRTEPTILPAVPLGFGIAEKDQAEPVLRQYASNQFSTNWGTRIVREDSRLFNPKGYHYGSVWPLFTGWTALAEYRYGKFSQGFSHIMDNLNVYRDWGKGFVEEVLNGSAYTPSGVCPHQCWSETMVLQPAIEGMLGLTPNAQENKLVFSPHVPAGWDSIRAENIPFRNHRFIFSMKRSGGTYTYHFTGIEPDHFTIEFTPSFPAGTVIKNVRANGRDFQFASFNKPDYVSVLVLFELNQDIVIEIETEKGIAVLPVVNRNIPGSSSEGLRIIDSYLAGNQYNITLEGRSGTSGIIECYMPGQKADHVENGKLTGSGEDLKKFEVSFEPGQKKYQTKNMVLHLK